MTEPATVTADKPKSLEAKEEASKKNEVTDVGHNSVAEKAETERNGKDHPEQQNSAPLAQPALSPPVADVKKDMIQPVQGTTNAEQQQDVRVIVSYSARDPSTSLEPKQPKEDKKAEDVLVSLNEPNKEKAKPPENRFVNGPSREDDELQHDFAVMR